MTSKLQSITRDGKAYSSRQYKLLKVSIAAFSPASIALVKVVIVRVALSLIGQRHMKMH